MKFTSDTANKTLKNLQAEMEATLNSADQSMTYSHGPAETPIIPKYDFKETEEKVQGLRKKIATIRHAINKFNVNTVIEDLGITVDEALGEMSYLNTKKKRLYRMLQIQETSRQRAFGGREPDITHRNFNIEDAKAEYDKVCEYLIKYQQAINIANLTITFEIEGI